MSVRFTRPTTAFPYPWGPWMTKPGRVGFDRLGDSTVRDRHVGLSWSDLRAWDGSQPKGFEELCAQLAQLETPAGAEFVRKGSPDSGVECFCKLEDGGEWGWQAKFFRRSLGDAQWRQIDRSVERALEAHPRLVRYFVCVPRDRSDSRRPGITTEMQKWEQRVSTWEGWAQERGMEVDFVWWGSSELRSLLSHDRQAGRHWFWFGAPGQFSNEWFDKQLERAVAVAGPRYTPEAHVDVPIVGDFELFGRTEVAEAAVRDLAKNIRQRSAYTIRRLAREDTPGSVPELGGVVESVEAVVGALYAMPCASHRQWPLSEIMSRIDKALEGLSECLVPLSRAADAFETRDETEEVSKWGRQNPYEEAARQVRALHHALRDARSKIIRSERAVNTDLLIVTGVAGSGKTHLLCDVATQRLAQGLPTVILMGQQFTTTEPPWTQARSQLDLTGLSAEQFVGALEAAAQAAGSKALFMIDAINEGEGQVIWRSHLADLLTHLKGSRWIGVVLSVRSPFADHIVPDPVRDTAHEVEHHGFADDPYTALERFCVHYDLDFPATPLLRHEFGNPLFLKTLCEGLHNRGERRIPVGSEGITTVFDRYLEATDATLATKLDYDPHDQVVARALAAVTAELAERGTRWLPKHKARELVDPLAPRTGYSLSLYRALVDTGLLMEVPGSGRDDEWSVAFGYDWFADHLIAKHLVARYHTAHELVSALTGADGESRLSTAWTQWNAPLEALSILLPELLGVELPEAFAGHSANPSIRRAFLKGLPWRDPSQIGSGCQEFIFDLLNEPQHQCMDLFDALMTCAIVPHHPLGASFLDDYLRRLDMPDRDAVWSRYLYLAYSSEGPLDRLLDWAEKRPDRAAALDQDTASACSAVLAWCLTASHRIVRDRATKGLVAVLTNKIPLACELIERFNDVDDTYVRERVMAAAYGVAMRSTDAQSLSPLAESVYRLTFADGKPPPHVLLRDYARGVIERAEYLGANIPVDTRLVEPPYRSEWPHIPDDSEMTILDPPFQVGRPEPSDAERAQGKIPFSVMRWDFAHYVIGTNSSSTSNRWLSVPIMDPPWQSPKERAQTFKRSLDPDLQEAFNELWTNTRTIESFISFVNSGVELGSDETDGSALPFVATAPYIDPELDALFVAALSDEQKTEYEEVKTARGTDEPRLGLDIIQRYVLWRVFDLGWNIDRHGDLDWLIYSSNIYSGRGTRKPERIGKKYQWIAYHEILAHISDHYQYRVSYSDLVPKDAYRGTWQLYVRDIDPSAILVAMAQRRERSEGSTKWWYHDLRVAPVDDVSNQQWLHCTSDIPDRDQQLRYTNPVDDSTWIKLHGMDIWESQLPAGYDRHEVDRREIWLYACGYFIDATDVGEFIDWSNTVDFSGRWMPEPPRTNSLFFGELGWSFASEALLGDQLASKQPSPRGGPPCPVPLHPAALQCSANGGEYDCSLANSAEFYRPNPRLVETMNLQWTGYGADFVHPDRTLAVFDPSAHDTGRDALLVKEEALARFLDQTRSALVWAIIGEKQAIKPLRSRRAQTGFLRLEGTCVYQPGCLAGDLTTRLE